MWRARQRSDSLNRCTAERRKNGVDDFVKSEVIKTPAVFGAATTMITGTLISLFDIAIEGKWICLAVSLLFGLVSTLDATKDNSMIQRLLFLVINWMTVFTVAVGINTAGMAATQGKTRLREVPSMTTPRGVDPLANRPFFQPWFK
jgi:hypothetical protein